MSTADLPLPTAAGTARLRAALTASAFTADGLLELLGGPAYTALARGETVPAARATGGDDSAPAVLVRLFLLQRPVPYERARAVLPVDGLLGDGWLLREGAGVRATVDVRPYAGPEGQDWWVVSDPGFGVGGAGGAGGRDRDVVLGVGGASMTLAQLTVREPVDRALDVGTGSGIQALHLAQHARRVVATDVNPRALRMAALTLGLSGAAEPELREGSLFEPVAREAGFDLIVANPPFVISPAQGADALTYRDGGMGGDTLCRTLVERSADRLTDGGVCQLLANWQHVEGEDWRERVASWVPAGCDAWIVQRERQDITEYTELWLRDAGVHRDDPAGYERLYGQWLAEFERRRTGGVGFGWITLTKTGSRRPSVTAEEWPHAVEQPLGETARRRLALAAFLRDHDDRALLATRFELAEGVVQEQVGAPGAEDPEHVVLRQRHGMMRAHAVDTLGAALAGACDGTLPAGVIVDAIAQLLEADPARVREGAPAVLRTLVGDGFLLPV
ncbi:methyltransferase [Streptomyces carpaticus]|uniref:DUF7059 domain-containing protein n=1 Tax=Streptomyces carpaticus TaxID=285558 RepID=UPI002209FA4B|nr:methyltransferase [Streptomyces carpaticus]